MDVLLLFTLALLLLAFQASEADLLFWEASPVREDVEVPTIEVDVSLMLVRVVVVVMVTVSDVVQSIVLAEALVVFQAVVLAVIADGVRLKSVQFVQAKESYRTPSGVNEPFGYTIPASPLSPSTMG